MEDSDIKRISDMLLPQLQKTIQTEVKNSHAALSDQITEVQGQVEAVKIQVEPIAQVYDTINGGGTVFTWIFQRIVIPVSVVIGIFLALHNLKK